MSEMPRRPSHKCLITYGSSGKSITQLLCAENKIRDVDECYTLTQRDLKYTLIHARKRFSYSAITSMMTCLNEVHGIKSACVFGYDAISMGEEIDEHPGMRMIIEGLKKESSTLVSWTAGGSIRDNKRGLLYNYMPGIDFKDMTRMQLLNQVKEMSGMVEEAKIKFAEMEGALIENEQLRVENRRLKRKVDLQEHIFITAGRASELLP